MDFQKELIAEFDQEVALTRKVLAAIPADADFSWKPNPKSFSLGRLVGHTAETPGEWALATLTQDKIDMGGDQKYVPYVADNVGKVLERYDKETAEARTALVGLDLAKWDEMWTMGSGDQIWVSDSRYRVYRTWVISHMIHHRAQLGVDLRLMGMKVPGVYGPSADEM